MAASSILKILLPERQINKKIYTSFDIFLKNLHKSNWIEEYIYWEVNLIKELGFEINILNNDKKLNINIVEINGRSFKTPYIFTNNIEKISNKYIKEALTFNKNILIENFIVPNKLRYPVSRNILEKYYN